jgi:hypothetical protein
MNKPNEGAGIEPGKPVPAPLSREEEEEKERADEELLAVALFMRQERHPISGHPVFIG